MNALHEALLFAALWAAACAPAVVALWPPRRGARDSHFDDVATSPSGVGGRADALLVGAVVGLLQFLLLAKFLFLAGVPCGVGGFLGVAVTHALLGFGMRAWTLRARRKGSAPPPLPAPVSPRWNAPAQALFAGILLATVAGLHDLTRAYGDSHFYWIAKAWTFVVDGSYRLHPYLHGPTYPLLVPTGHAWFLAFDSVPGAALWQNALLACALLHAARYVARKGGRFGAVVAFATLLPTMPAVVRAGLGDGLYADVPMAATFLFAVVTLAETLEGARSRAWPAAVALAACAMTKVNGTLYLLPVLAVAAPCVAFGLRGGDAPSVGESGSDGFARRCARLLGLFGPAVAVSLAWRTIVRLQGSHEGADDLALRVLREEILGSPAPLASLLHKAAISACFFAEWFALDRPASFDFLARAGWIPPLAFLAGPALIARVRRRPGEATLAAGALGSAIVVVFAMYTLVPAADDARAHWWLRTGAARAVAHALPLLATVAALGLARAAEIAPAPSREPRQSSERGAPASDSSPAWRRRAFLALLVLAPSVAATISGAIGSRAEPRLAAFATRGERQFRAPFEEAIPADWGDLRADPFGFYEPERWGDAEVRWAAPRVRVPVLVRGARLSVAYVVGHTDISGDAPVEVRVRVVNATPDDPGEGRIDPEAPDAVASTHATTGYHARSFRVPPHVAHAVVEIEASRPMVTPEGRVVGVAIYDWGWSP